MTFQGQQGNHLWAITVSAFFSEPVTFDLRRTKKLLISFERVLFPSLSEVWFWTHSIETHLFFQLPWQQLSPVITHKCKQVIQRVFARLSTKFEPVLTSRFPLKLLPCKQTTNKLNWKNTPFPLCGGREEVSIAQQAKHAYVYQKKKILWFTCLFMLTC